MPYHQELMLAYLKTSYSETSAKIKSITQMIIDDAQQISSREKALAIYNNLRQREMTLRLLIKKQHNPTVDSTKTPRVTRPLSLLRMAIEYPDLYKQLSAQKATPPLSTTMTVYRHNSSNQAALAPIEKTEKDVSLLNNSFFSNRALERQFKEIEKENPAPETETETETDANTNTNTDEKSDESLFFMFDLTF